MHFFYGHMTGDRKKQPDWRLFRQCTGVDLVDGSGIHAELTTGRMGALRPSGQVRRWNTRDTIARPFKYGMRESVTLTADNPGAPVTLDGRRVGVLVEDTAAPWAPQTGDTLTIPCQSMTGETGRLPATIWASGDGLAVTRLALTTGTACWAVTHLGSSRRIGGFANKARADKARRAIVALIATLGTSWAALTTTREVHARFDAVKPAIATILAAHGATSGHRVR